MNQKHYVRSWRETLDSRAMLLNAKATSLILEQQTAFASSTTPKIADPVVKSIPIIESDEALVDLKKIANKRISMLPDPTSPFQSPDCNSGFASSSKMRKSLYERLEQMLVHLDELSPEFGYHVGQIEIRVFEGLRDIVTQNTLFENKKKEISLTSSKLTDEELDAETSKWVSPVKDNIPVHSTGAAVDIRLCDQKTGDFVDMGKFGVIWEENKTAHTFSEEISDSQKTNRLFCLIAAEKAGLTNYSYEFWHFSYKDRYASYWRDKEVDKRHADYGPAKL